jgi:hypothetical protein
MFQNIQIGDSSGVGNILLLGYFYREVAPPEQKYLLKGRNIFLMDFSIMRLLQCKWIKV